MVEIINVSTLSVEVLSYKRESQNCEDPYTNTNCPSNHIIY